MNHLSCSSGWSGKPRVLALVPDARPHLEEAERVAVAVVVVLQPRLGERRHDRQLGRKPRLVRLARHPRRDRLLARRCRRGRCRSRREARPARSGRTPSRPHLIRAPTDSSDRGSPSPAGPGRRTASSSGRRPPLPPEPRRRRGSSAGRSSAPEARPAASTGAGGGVTGAGGGVVGAAGGVVGAGGGGVGAARPAVAWWGRGRWRGGRRGRGRGRRRRCASDPAAWSSGSGGTEGSWAGGVVGAGGGGVVGAGGGRRGRRGGAGVGGGVGAGGGVEGAGGGVAGAGGGVGRRRGGGVVEGVLGVDGVLGVVGSGGGGVPPSESEVAATGAAGAAPALAGAGSANTSWIRSSCPANVEKPSPSIGHGVTISVGRSDGSSEASSFARSRAAMFDCGHPRAVDGHDVDRVAAGPVGRRARVPICRSWSRESVSSTDTSRWSAPPLASAACASGENCRFELCEERRGVGRDVNVLRGAARARRSRRGAAPRRRPRPGRSPPASFGLVSAWCTTRCAAPWRPWLVHLPQRLDPAPALGRRRHERAGEATSRDSRISSVCSAFPLPAENSRGQIGQVERLAGGGRVAPEARPELPVGQQPLEQLGSAVLLRRRHRRSPSRRSLRRAE